VDEASWSPRDKQIAPWFALLTVVGVGILLSTALFMIAPMVLEFTVRMGSALARGTAAGALFWDSAVSLLMVTLELVVLPLLVGRRRDRTTT